MSSDKGFNFLIFSNFSQIKIIFSRDIMLKLFQLPEYNTNWIQKRAYFMSTEMKDFVSSPERHQNVPLCDLSSQKKPSIRLKLRKINFDEKVNEFQQKQQQKNSTIDHRKIFEWASTCDKLTKFRGLKKPIRHVYCSLISFSK